MRPTPIPRVSLLARLMGLALAAPGLSWSAGAGVVSDTSWGRTPQSFSGRFELPESLGRRAGANLFHSFERFSLSAGESATFTTQSTSLSNVIARVSGTEASLIDGALRLSAAGGSAPNFYFINPQGITFGPNGSVSVPAALHLSTSNELRFADGQVFPAGRGPDSRLSVAAPEAFGFLGGATAAPISLSPQARLLLTDNQRDLDLTAADLLLKNAGLYTTNGQLRLVAVGAVAASVPVDTTASPAIAQLGGQIMLQGSYIRTSSGNILLRAGTIELADLSLVGSNPNVPADVAVDLLARESMTIDGSFVSSIMEPNGAHGPSLRVESLGSLVLSGVKGGGISSITTSSSGAGDIFVSAASLTLRGQAGVLSSADTGPSGRITVNVKGPLLLQDDSSISNKTFPSTMNPAAVDRIGAAGLIDIRAASLTVDGSGAQTGGAANISSTSVFVPSPAGQININVTGLISLRGGGTISTSAFANPDFPPFATQSAGSINIVADAIRIESSAGATKVSAISSDALGSEIGLAPGPGGTAGKINVSARDITILGGFSVISTDSSGPGIPGSISVTAERLLLDGLGQGNAFISSTGSGSGGGGSVSVKVADSLSMIRGGVIDARAIGSGPGGRVQVEAGQMTVDGAGGAIVTGPLGISFGDGAAGDLSIRVGGQLSLLRGGVVSSSTFGAGRAGAIDIQVHDLLVDAQGDGFTGVRSRAAPESSGQVGRISVIVDGEIRLLGAPEAFTVKNESLQPAAQGLAAQALVVSAGRLVMDGAGIVASSSGSAPGSAINVSVTDHIGLRNDSRILTSSVDGNGGPIAVEAPRYLVLRDSQITSSVLGQTNGNGGSIRVAAPALVLVNGSIQANTTALRATGGDIGIDVQALISGGNALAIGGGTVVPFEPGAKGFSVIQAAAPGGVSGQVQVAVPALDLSGTLADLEVPPIDLGALARDVCRIGTGSSLVRVGRGAMLPSLTELSRPGL